MNADPPPGEVGPDSVLAQRLRQCQAIHAIHNLTLFQTDGLQDDGAAALPLASARPLRALLEQVLKHAFDALAVLSNPGMALRVDDTQVQLGSYADERVAACAEIRVRGQCRGELRVVADALIAPLDDEAADAFIEEVGSAVGAWLERHERIAYLRIYEQSIAHAEDPMAVIDRQLRIILANHAYAGHLGVPLDALRGQLLADFLGCGEDAAETLSQLQHCLLGHHIAGQRWLDCQRRSARCLFSMRLTPLAGISGVEGVVLNLHDITHVHEARQQLEQMAHRDALTGLPNRILFDDVLERSLHKARRTGGRLAVMFIDLDRFKEVNDTLGHAAGDELLKLAAVRLSSCLRAADTLARLGGDEFVALIDDFQQAHQVSKIASKLMRALSAPFRLSHAEGGATDVQISCSIGISLYPDDAQEGTRLMSHADTAMYQAKSHGRNDWRFYTVDMTDAANRHLKILNGLRAALKNRELIQLYQPLVDIRSGEPLGVEALTRWLDPQLGATPPAVFVPVAEQGGLIRELDEWQLKAACAQMQAWALEGVMPPRISINVSGHTLSSPSFAIDVASKLREYDIPASALQLEIKEALLQAADREVMQNLNAIIKVGVSIALDDFGTGYAALSRLRELPIRTLKIDTAFLRQHKTQKADHIIAHSLIAMGQAMGMELIAEGIEDAQQAEFVREHGSLGGQGFFFSQPLSASAVANLIRDSRSA